MPEAVIVSAVRTPIGRARKGSLVDARPDDLVAFAIDSALNQVPELDRSQIADVMVGCGFPEQRQGMNLARRAALLAGLPAEVPGTTVNRFCASSLQTIRMAWPLATFVNRGMGLGMDAPVKKALGMAPERTLSPFSARTFTHDSRRHQRPPAGIERQTRRQGIYLRALPEARRQGSG